MEAFKVSVPAQVLWKPVQEKMFQLGFEWNNGIPYNDVLWHAYGSDTVITGYEHKDMTYGTGQTDPPFISLEELFKMKASIKVQMNDESEAVIEKGVVHIKGQVISFAAVELVYKAIQNKKKTPEFLEFKVVVPDERLSVLVQQRLFELGYRWSNSKANVLYDGAWYYKEKCCFYTDKMGLITHGRSYEGPKTVSLETLFAPDFMKPVAETVYVCQSYNAEVHKDKVVVGCQTFTFDAVEALYKACLSAPKS